MNDLKDEFKEVIMATLPICIVIILIQISLIQLPFIEFIQFIIGAVMTIVGLGLFMFGVKVGLLPLGEQIGSTLPAKGTFPIVLLFGFILGFVVTAAEPDLRILASQVDEVSEGLISQNVLIYTVAIGVGIFVLLSMIRSIFGIKLIHILLPSYILIFILSFFVAEDFIPIAFDAGGVTTGPVTVPFILALNIGVVSVLADRNNLGSGFGLVAMASVGPIMALLILGVFMGG